MARMHISKQRIGDITRAGTFQAAGDESSLAALLRQQCLISAGEHCGHSLGVGAREADQHHRIVAVVVGEIVEVREGFAEHGALVRLDALDQQGIAVLLEAGQELAFHFEGGRAVGGRGLDERLGEEDFGEFGIGHDGKVAGF